MESRSDPSSEVVLSERSSTIVLPPLSRYARPAEPARPDEGDESDAATPEERRDETARSAVDEASRPQGWLRRKLARPAPMAEPEITLVAEMPGDDAEPAELLEPVDAAAETPADARSEPSAYEPAPSVDLEDPGAASDDVADTPSRGADPIGSPTVVGDPPEPFAASAAPPDSTREPLDSEQAERSERPGESTPESRALVSVPTVLPHRSDEQPRSSFWQRIAARGGLARQADRGVATKTDIQPILERIDALESLLADGQKASLARSELHEEALRALETEVDLSDVRERLALVEAAQMEIADGLHALARNVMILVGLVGMAAIGGAVAAWLLLW